MDAIIFNKVTKKYELLKERKALITSLLKTNRKNEAFALKNVSFRIKKGETVGIIGENGAGKSTILKLIAGIIQPTSGHVITNGRIASLIELGAGFHSDLTGQENVYLNGMLLGLTKKELNEKYNSIVEFADIGEYINQPIRTYSSGMTVRLGFSVAVHLEPDVLLIDEVLAVGDESFQRKCVDKILQLRKRETTIIFVSHNLSLISSLCDLTILLENNKVKYIESSKEVVNKYLLSLKKISGDIKKNSTSRWGSGEINITGVKFLNENGKSTKYFYPGEKILVRIYFKMNSPVSSPVFGIAIYRNNISIFGTNTFLDDIELNNLPQKGSIDYIIGNGTLNIGSYNISVAVHNIHGNLIYDWHDKMYELEIISNKKQKKYSRKAWKVNKI